MRIFNLIGWLALVGLVFGASIAFPKKKPSPAPSHAFSPVSYPTAAQSHPHKITLTIAALSELKIKVGDPIQPGTILSDRLQERQELAARLQQIEAEIGQLSLPIPPVPLPVPVNLASEEIALRQAKLKLAQIQQHFDRGSGLQFKQLELSEVFESDKVKQIDQLHNQQHQAHLEVESAIARLNEARIRQQQQQYENSLRLAEYRTRLQRQQYELTARRSQRQTLIEQQQNLVVRAPYRGKVHRIKILGQQERKITVEIILSVRNNP
jgi:biotin carboxyl carrier protein